MKSSKVVNGKVVISSPFAYGDRVEMTSVVLSNGVLLLMGSAHGKLFLQRRNS
ncbi:hypothetical protein [uncultured Enterococcus sp.]|uniref:hypothetical protein n=1 Tax=uncultured Enterococcus sp. TaxID=167972 RepID=UPI002AA6C8E6|nr:hypothetical protein [uncultured Enterococcus sp.]